VIAGLLFFAILIGGQMTVMRTLLWTLLALVLLIIIEVIEAIPLSRTAAEPDTSVSA
jgi:hypothetical protein